MDPDNPKPVNLLSWLTSDRHKVKVEQIRAIQDKEARDAIKKTLPAITPSGLFTRREVNALTAHSGFIAIDIDFKDNQHISNYSQLKEQLSKLQNLAYCGLSVSGAGFWGLVPIFNTEKHRGHFLALCQDFKRFGIILDKSGSDVCRLRTFSWDPDAHFNHSAKPYTKIYVPQPAPRYSTPVTSDTREKVEKIITEISLHKIDVTSGYDNWFQIACALSNEFGESGRGYFHTVSRFHPKYSAKDADHTFNGCLKHDYNKVTIASFFKIAADHNVKTKPDPVITTPRPDVNYRAPIPSVPVFSKSWDKNITDLEQFFATATLPGTPIRLDRCSIITDVSLFINSHLSILKGQNGNKRYSPYLDRLTTLKTLL